MFVPRFVASNPLSAHSILFYSLLELDFAHHGRFLVGIHTYMYVCIATVHIVQIEETE